MAIAFQEELTHRFLTRSKAANNAIQWVIDGNVVIFKRIKHNETDSTVLVISGCFRMLIFACYEVDGHQMAEERSHMHFGVYMLHKYLIGLIEDIDMRANNTQDFIDTYESVFRRIAKIGQDMAKYDNGRLTVDVPSEKFNGLLLQVRTFRVPNGCNELRIRKQEAGLSSSNEE